MGMGSGVSLTDNDISIIEEERDSFAPQSISSTTSHNAIMMATAAPEAKGTPTDPGLDTSSSWDQWHHTGANGLNTIPVWQDYTGEGIRVGILDDGFNYNHSELSNNFRTDLDYDVLGNDFDSINDANDRHGTWVAQVIGADDNGEGGVGVAFDSDLVGIRRGFGGEGNTQDTVDAFQYAYDNDFDIINNSWGITRSFGDNKNINFIGADSTDVIDKFEQLVELGRDGLGANIVFSAGNSRAEGKSANYKNYQNSPYSITVAATEEDGTYASFSEAGSNVLLSAPGHAIAVSNADGNGTVQFINGTSFSAPAVSGVIALMLEANEELGYRDVQEILAMSSRQTDIGGTGWADEGWQENGATNWNGGGMTFSHDYGFGLADAHAAVRLAETWNIQQTYNNMTTVSSGNLSPSMTIPTTGTITTSVNITQDIEIEHILIDLDISHSKAGDLVVTLISPSGTESVLMYNVDNGSFTTAYGVYQGVNFEFSSVAHWGESSAGIWTLKIEDTAAGNAGTLNNWSLEFWGNDHRSNDLYVYTNEFAGATGDRTILMDTDGGIDTINAAAVTSDTILDLGSAGVIAGTTLAIPEGSEIENAYTGDGNDTVTGNEFDNHIVTGRGDDSIYSSAGNDTIDGGQGDDTAFYNFDISQFVIDLVDETTVIITDLAESFTHTWYNIEFFNFNNTNYSWSEVNDYLNTPQEVDEVEFSIWWSGGRSNVTNNMVGTHILTEAELGKHYSNNDIIEVTRTADTIAITSLDPVAFRTRKITLDNDDLREISIDGFMIVNIDHDQATVDTEINVLNARWADIESGSGHDTIHVSDKPGDRWSFWKVESGAGDDVVTINSFATKSAAYVNLMNGDDHYIYAGGGRNFVFAGNGNDTVQTGLGNDFVHGQNGNDIINGQGGNDYINGGRGNDQLFGGTGNDYLIGGSGNDYISGGQAHDLVRAGSGDDEIYGDQGDDILLGQGGDDIVVGGAGDDIIRGNAGDDLLIGGEGADRLYGGRGYDTFKLDRMDSEVDSLHGFYTRFDTLDIADILTGYDSSTDDINDFVEILHIGGRQSQLNINSDGDGGAFTQAAVIYGDINSQTVDELLTNGILIAE